MNKQHLCRWLAAAGAAALLAGGLSGCAGGGDNSTASASPSGTASTGVETIKPYTEKEIDLGSRDFTILMLGGSGSVFPNPDSDSYEDDLARIQYVEEKYHCTLKFDTTYGYPEIHEYIVTNAVAGLDVADIMYSLPWQTVDPYITQNIAVPLNDYLDFSVPTLADMNLNKWGSFLDNQYIFVVSKSGVNCGLLYNKDIFERDNLEDPFELQQKGEWTWEKFLEICQKVTKTTSSGVEQWGYYDEYLFVTCILTNGGEIIGRDSSGNYKFNLNSEKAKKGMNFALDLLNKYKVVPHVGSVGDPILLDMFKQGNVAFTTYAPEYGPEAVAKGIKASDLGYTYPPKGPDATDYVIHAATYSPVYVVPPQLDETWKKQVICVLQDMLCVWDSSKPFAVKKADILDIGFSKSEYKGIYENNKDFMLNGGKKNKVAYLNSFKLFDMLNENLIYPLFKGETTMESALSKVTPMAQSRIDEYVALTKGK